jgi:hypothetical protein
MATRDDIVVRYRILLKCERFSGGRCMGGFEDHTDFTAFLKAIAREDADDNRKFVGRNFFLSVRSLDYRGEEICARLRSRQY